MNKFTIQKSFAISAGAGSGKTYTLSRRYINAIVGFDFFIENAEQAQHEQVLKSARVNEIVTITYTDAAALEMKERIFALMKKVERFPSLDHDDNDYTSIAMAYSKLNDTLRTHVKKCISKAIQESGSARISTFHTYCLALVKRYADLAKIDSNPKIIEDTQKNLLYEQITFEVLNSLDNKESVLELSKSLNLHLLNTLIKKFLSDEKFRQNFLSFTKDSLEQDLLISHIKALYPLPNKADIDDELTPEISKWLDSYLHNFELFEAVKWSDVFDEKAPTLGVKKYPSLTAFKERCDALVPYYCKIEAHKEKKFYYLIETLKSILIMIKEKYDHALLAENYLDFDQIIVKAHQLLPHVTSNIKYFMVDEFQDTNALQFEIVKKSCSPDTNLFVVGDAKQSIYAFQSAEIEVFNTAVADKNLFDSVVPMNNNHRSDGIVLTNVNSIFDKLLETKSMSPLIEQNFEAAAGALHVYKEDRKYKGSFRFILTRQTYEQKEGGIEQSEFETIASLIQMIKDNEAKAYEHIYQKIAAKERAIAVVFDAKTKMLELKCYLNDLGIKAKVSASENFYHTKEITEIFHLLKAVEIVNRKKKDYSKKERFYLLGALRSNYLRVPEDKIAQINWSQNFAIHFEYIILQSKKLCLSALIKHLYDSYSIYDVYTHFSDTKQRISNLEKFLHLAIEYEAQNGNDLYRFVSLLEKSIYFSDSSEEEAFYKADGSSSIELCSIHSTKGLAYPMVILANSDKSLYSQIQSDVVKHNHFTQTDGELKEVVGFKVDGYEPLSFRLLKEIDKQKHLAEKKRLLYVALTRAEHDVLISGKLSYKKDGQLSLSKESYLYMMIDALKDENSDVCKSLSEHDNNLDLITPNKYRTTKEKRKKIKFHDIKLHDNFICDNEIAVKESATSGIEKKSTTATLLGNIVHEMIETYWSILTFENISEVVETAHYELDSDERAKVTRYLVNFLQSDVYQKLQLSQEHYFELAFEYEDSKGFIDLIYFDKKLHGYVIVDFKTTNMQGMSKADALIHYGYDKQLAFYKQAIEKELGEGSVVKSEVCWLAV